MRMLESDAKKIFDSGVGNNFGMKSSAEILQHLVQRTDTGVRMATAVQANALIENTNKAMTTGDMNQFFSNAYVGAQAARVEVNTRLQPSALPAELRPPCAVQEPYFTRLPLQGSNCYLVFRRALCGSTPVRRWNLGYPRARGDYLSLRGMRNRSLDANGGRVL